MWKCIRFSHYSCLADEFRCANDTTYQPALYASPLSLWLGPTLSHGHYEENGQPEIEGCGMIQENLAILRIPSSNPLLITTIKAHPVTDEGKRVCQQILADLANFWLGKPMEYLALYRRDW